MLLIKESVVSFEVLKPFKTNPLYIIFDDFSI